MNIKPSSYQPILNILSQGSLFSVKQITERVGVSRQLVQKYLKYMLENNLVIKHGTSPHVYYSLQKERLRHNIVLPYDIQQQLNQYFLQFDVQGNELRGSEGRIEWCQQRGLDPIFQSEKFLKYIRYTNDIRDDFGLIHQGYEKFCNQVDKPFLDDLLYCDVYQIAQFGRSKLGNLAFYAKQSQSLSLLKEVGKMTNNQIQGLVSTGKYDAVCFTPHSLKRNIQIMDYLKDFWDLHLPTLDVKKIYTGNVIIPQKSIKGTQQRIRNAEQTIFYLGGETNIQHLLLIDDFVGSGATLNISARKIKQANAAKKITGLALVGNIDMSYEVINEF